MEPIIIPEPTGQPFLETTTSVFILITIERCYTSYHGYPVLERAICRQNLASIVVVPVLGDTIPTGMELSCFLTSAATAGGVLGSTGAASCCGPGAGVGFTTARNRFYHIVFKGPQDT
eukprot:sb/3476427/